MKQAKPFDIPKRDVWSAYEQVKANRGTYGVDMQSIQDFEECLEDNLYKVWNRLSSGSYFPPPVRCVEIPKKEGGRRSLGIPTVADRIAQTVVKKSLEPKLEPSFHQDSYGYRPGRSTKQALGMARQRCWHYDWVLDLDVRDFFGNLDHELLMKAVDYHSPSKWERLYITRWLKAPVVMRDDTQMERQKGTPQGGVISPLLANLFLHYAFDKWMEKVHPSHPFERYADDIIVHCKTEQEAKELKAGITERLGQCKLELHPQKTKIVYCKDDNRKGDYSEEKFDFLSYTFRPRTVKNFKGCLFTSFSPAMSSKAAKRIREKIRGWRLHLRTGVDIETIAEQIAPVVRGWVLYYGQYHRSALYPTLKQLDRYLVRWAMRKYKTLRRKRGKAWNWLHRIARREPDLFAHWALGFNPAAGR